MKDDTGGNTMRMKNEQIAEYFKEQVRKELENIKKSKKRKVPFIEIFVDVGRVNNLVRETLK